MAKLMNAYSKVHFWSDSEGNIQQQQQQQNAEHNINLLKEEATGQNDSYSKLFPGDWNSSSGWSSSSVNSFVFGNGTETLNLVHIQVALNVMTVVFFLYIIFLAMGLSNTGGGDAGSDERNLEGPVNLKDERSSEGKSVGKMMRTGSSLSSFLKTSRLKL